jgi:hypothetical protein
VIPHTLRSAGYLTSSATPSAEAASDEVSVKTEAGAASLQLVRFVLPAHESAAKTVRSINAT